MTPPITRVVKVIVDSVRRPPMGVLDKSAITMRVWPSDLDLNFHMNNGRYLTLMDLGRIELMVRTGMWRLVVYQGWRPIVGSSLFRFRRPLAVYSSYKLETQILCWDTKWFFVEQRFVRKGKPYGTGIVKALIRDGSRNVPPEELMGALGQYVESPPFPASISDWLEAENKFNSEDRLHSGL